MVTTTGFSPLARHTANAGGIAEIALAEYPGPLGMHDAATIARNIDAGLIDRIVAGLTRASSASPDASDVRDPRAIVYRGSAEEIDRHFCAQQWSDGFPIVAPTIERVERFLAFTDEDPHEQIAVLASANLAATPWNIAVNAVMAGCSPEHMPLILAAVEALGDERASLNNIGSSSGIFPFVLINGPIVEALAINTGAQLVSRAPNTSIGRAVGLIVRNIAGFRPGTSYMGTFGYPLAFALAENAAASPWAPFHVEQGYRPDANTVTLGVTNNWGSAPAPYDTPEQSGARTALDLICKEITHKTRLFNFPGRGPNAEHVMITIMLSPPVARSLAAAGYGKQDVKRYVFENTKMRLADFEWTLKFTNIRPTTAREQVEAGVFADEFLGPPESLVRVLSSPDVLHIVVCGDPNRNRIMVLEGGHTRPTTKPVRLPANWAALMAARDARESDH